jgi:hypothetical protein
MGYWVMEKGRGKKGGGNVQRCGDLNTRFEGREGVQGHCVWYVIKSIYFGWWKFNLFGKALSKFWHGHPLFGQS